MAQQVNVGGIFSGVEKAKMRFDAIYQRPGHYLERIEEVKFDQNRKGRAFVVIVKTVVAVLSQPDQAQHRVGDEIQHMLMCDNDSFLPSIKQFVARVCGVKPEDVDEEACIQLCSQDQPLRNAFVETIAQNVKTRENKDFTRITYVREHKPDELRKELAPEVFQKFVAPCLPKQS